jgi:hypothetical protein
MRKIILFALVVLSSMLSFAQDSTIDYGTTLEEYNYVTKGYATQVEQGLDMKKGYELVSTRPGYGYGSKTVINLSDGSSIGVQLELLFNSTKLVSERAVMVTLTNKPYDIKRHFCIPNGYSSEDLWAKYWDDIKFLDSNELLSLAYALSKSKSLEVTCFPENSLVKMFNGSEKPIQEIVKGDSVLTYNFENRSIDFAIVQELNVHSNETYSISRVKTLVSDNRTASLTDFVKESVFIEATNNHPVRTENGHKAFGELNLKDKLYCYSEESQDLVLCEIVSIEYNVRKVDSVYNLNLDSSNNFIVNGALVLTK